MLLFSENIAEGPFDFSLNIVVLHDFLQFEDVHPASRDLIVIVKHLKRTLIEIVLLCC